MLLQISRHAASHAPLSSNAVYQFRPFTASRCSWLGWRLLQPSASMLRSLPDSIDCSRLLSVSFFAALCCYPPQAAQGLGIAAKTLYPQTLRYVTAWLRLTNPSYLEEWSKEIPSSKTSKTWTLQVTHHQQSTELTLLPTLGRHIIEGQAKSDDVELVGEFHYIKGYWEWTKYVLSRCKNSFQKVKIYDDVYASLFMYDNNSKIMRAFCEAWCPSTNTLLTSFGELSVSLWDLQTLVGLSISGSLYNEVVPCAKELTCFNVAASRFLPRSCGYLLHDYHHLRKFVNGGQSSQVHVSEWIRFWSKKSMKYNKTPPRIEKKRVARLISTYNPLGNLDVNGEWSPAEKAYFSKINIKESLREETYLAPFLACGLCVCFSHRRHQYDTSQHLQDGGDHGKWANSKPCSSCLGKHLQGEGGAKYYDPTYARKRIHKGELVSLTCTMITKEKDFTYVDNGNAEEFERNYFLAIFSKYLPLRQGGYFIVESYSPHRFGRQFGFYQVVPGVFNWDVCRAFMDEGIQYWRLCILSKSFSKACLLCMPPNAKKFSSEDYKTWWNKVHGCYFQENIASLINMEQIDDPPRGTKPNNRGGPVDANGQASLHVAPLANDCNAQANKRKSISHHVEESSSNVDRHWKRPKKDSGSLPS
ncbi:hypothetical protein DH2020_018742 [Rehmannia glutinosa]|uniref:Aminotransferase-like plant mobile domain-containing protein n=1 Tax=Rehmannia glutinosa TaxID=99300 RepID=A0ABR0WKY7_REHGL